jgi:thiol-disulfide isomerase/thioredoxin
MRITLFIAWIAAAGLCLPAAAAEVHWYTTIEEASSAALKTNKPIMIDFWAGWCSACKVMEKEVYTDRSFAEASDLFLLVRIDFDKKTALSRKYNVTALPTLVFTDSYGGELFRHFGFLGVGPLVALMRSLPGDVAEFNELNRILARDKNNFEALRSMGWKLRSASLFLASNDYYERALQRNEIKVNPAMREAIMSDIGSNSLEVKDGKHAAEVFEKCLKEFPNSQHKTEWTLGLGRAYALAEKKDKARKLLDAFIRENAGSVELEKAKALLNSL